MDRYDIRLKVLYGTEILYPSTVDMPSRGRPWVYKPMRVWRKGTVKYVHPQGRFLLVDRGRKGVYIPETVSVLDFKSIKLFGKQVSGL